MDHPAPTVSITIRAFRRRWLADAIESVLQQTYRDLELVVYDDARDLRDVVEGFGDPRLRYHAATERLGPGGRYLAAVALCRGRYVGVLDDDDRYRPEFVAELVGALAADESAGVAFCGAESEIDGVGVHRERDEAPPGRVHDAIELFLSRKLTVRPSRMMVRRTALDDALRDQPMPDGVAPDFFVNVRAALAGWSHVHVPTTLVTLRSHEAQVSRSTASDDISVATWTCIEIDDPPLDRMRRVQLSRSHLARAAKRVVSGDRSGARSDVDAAASVTPRSWRIRRTVLRAAAQAGFVGQAVIRTALRRRERRRVAGLTKS